VHVADLSVERVAQTVDLAGDPCGVDDDQLDAALARFEILRPSLSATKCRPFRGLVPRRSNRSSRHRRERRIWVARGAHLECSIGRHRYAATSHMD